jgi:hypothetical protein
MVPGEKLVSSSGTSSWLSLCEMTLHQQLEQRGLVRVGLTKVSQLARGKYPGHTAPGSVAIGNEKDGTDSTWHRGWIQSTRINEFATSSKQTIPPIEHKLYTHLRQLTQS